MDSSRDNIIHMNMTESKKETRKSLRLIWKSMSDEEIGLISSKIRTEILNSPLWDEADSVLAFLAFGREISLDDLIVRSIASGKKVYVPRVEGEIIRFYRISSLDDTGLETSRMGIREPSTGNEHFTPEPGKATLILVPGLGFTENGKRMGRGGGFYDRFLKDISGLQNLTTVGICSDKSTLEEIPAEAHDMRVQNLCSESGLKKITPGTGPSFW